MNNMEQNILRENLTNQVKDYLGYAEDVHDDYISVNEKTFEVGYRPRYDKERKPNLQYYSVLDLIDRDGLWFKPDTKAIEAVVQEHIPSPEVKEMYDNAIKSISDFLQTNIPTELHTCEICIDVITHEISCFDSNNVDDVANEDGDIDESDMSCCSFYPMRNVVSEITTGYKISGFKLTKIILDFIHP